MSVGLIALLDDVAGLARMAAASLDDVIGQATKAGAKAAGVVIDDGAVTPRYVVGFAAERELPIVGRIALGSLRNKMLILLPAALLLSLFAPWAITPLLLIGGIYLCYEGTEKVWEVLVPHAAHAHEAARMTVAAGDTAALEDRKVADAIKTDFILSAEIMAITLASLPPGSLGMRAAVLAVVGLGITLLVYGAVALIVKADDLGVHLARSNSPGLGGRMSRGVGRTLVRAMPLFLQVLGVVGTAAMIWVGGGIVLHGLAEYGLGAMAHAIHGVAQVAASALPALGGLVAWLVEAAGAGIAGLVVGAAAIPMVAGFARLRRLAR